MAAQPLLRSATPIVRDDLRPLVREAIPLFKQLRPSLRDLNRATPRLVRIGKVLNYLANELGYNPPGPEEGYLFWLAVVRAQRAVDGGRRRRARAGGPRPRDVQLLDARHGRRR